MAELRFSERRYYASQVSLLSARNLQNDSHRWWKSAKAACGIESTVSIPPLVDPQSGALNVSAEEKADCLNAVFAAQCSAPPSTPGSREIKSVVQEKFSFAPISSLSVYNRLSKLNTWKAPGLDGICNFVLKSCAGALAKHAGALLMAARWAYFFFFSFRLASQAYLPLAEPLAHIFNSSLVSGKYPSQWKRGVIKPLYKHKGDRSNPAFYRPVVLLPCVSKVFEGCVREQLQDHCLRNHAMPDEQFGFLPKRSAVWQLLEVVDTWHRVLDTGASVHACFLDLAKAFDRVDHSLLFQKLSSVGVSNEDLSWFKSYLSDRTVCTEVDGHKSSFRAISSGVPQGSVLGPLLFIIFYRDLPSVISSSCAMFADDTLIFDSCSKHTTSGSCCRLQDDLVKLHAWADDWSSSFNASKSVEMVIGKRQARNSRKPPLVLGSSEIPRDHQTCHLGVTLTDRLSWSAHLSKVQKKLAFKLFCLKRLARRSGSAAIVKRLFVSFIRSSLEYAAPVWDACPIRDAMALERIQLSIARAVLKLSRHDHSNISVLEAIGWPSLAWRRRRFKLLLLWDLLHGGGPPLLHEQVPPTVSSRSPYPLRNSLSISLPTCHSSRYSKSFLVSAISLYNSLPQSVSSCSSKHSFAQALNHHFASDKFFFFFLPVYILQGWPDS